VRGSAHELTIFELSLPIFAVMPETIVDEIKEQLEYMVVMQGTSALSEADWKATLDVAKNAILMTVCKQTQVPVHTCTDIIRLLMGSPFLGAQRSEISKAVNSRKAGQSTVVDALRRTDGKHKPQSCMQYHKLLTKEMWDKMMSGTCTRRAILDMNVQHMTNLGLVYATEPTYGHIAITISMALTHQPGHDIVANRLDIYVLNDDLKKEVRLIRDKCKLPHYGEILTYPSSVDDLKAEHPEIYQKAFPDGDPNKAPMPCPLSELGMIQLEAVTPLRNTHSSMRQTASCLPSKRQKLLENRIQDVDLPGFRLCTPQGRREVQRPGADFKPFGGGFSLEDARMIVKMAREEHLPALTNDPGSSLGGGEQMPPLPKSPGHFPALQDRPPQCIADQANVPTVVEPRPVDDSHGTTCNVYRRLGCGS